MIDSLSGAPAALELSGGVWIIVAFVVFVFGAVVFSYFTETGTDIRFHAWGDHRGDAPHRGFLFGIAQRLLEAPRFGDVADEASGVDELVIFPASVGIDHHLLDGFVLASKIGREVVDVFTPHQPGPELLKHFWIDVELAQGMADVFFAAGLSFRERALSQQGSSRHGSSQ